MNNGYIFPVTESNFPVHSLLYWLSGYYWIFFPWDVIHMWVEDRRDVHNAPQPVSSLQVPPNIMAHPSRLPLPTTHSPALTQIWVEFPHYEYHFYV